MTHDHSKAQGNNINDPDQSPADIADHEERTEETREEHSRTGEPHDEEGHTPKVPGSTGSN